MEYIKDVPVTGDETKILQGDIGEYIVSARRKNKDWYIGAMTNELAERLPFRSAFWLKEITTRKFGRMEKQFLR